MAELGLGNTNERSTPGPGINLSGASAYKLSAGAHHTCAVRSTGGVRCWGRNIYGQLGQGSNGGIISNPASIEDIALYQE